MSSSGVPRRMREAHPSVFIPKTFFFSPLENEYRSEWADCFSLKAAAIYSAIFGMDADEFLVAEKFLKCIAFYCLNPVEKAVDPALAVPSSDYVYTSVQRLPDEPEEISIATLVEEHPTELPIKIKETCDAIYIVVVFLKHLKQWAEEDREKIDNNVILKHGPHLISDMALLDNQLLLDHSINLIQNFDQAVMETLKFIRKDSKGSSPSIDCLKLPFNREDFHEVVSLFCWYYSPFYTEKKKFHGRLAKELNTKNTLLECLHYCLVKPTKDNQALLTTKVAQPIPTAKELAWSGVRFEADTDGAIQVQFTEPVFKLPALVFDTKMEIVVSNLIALENSKLQRPVTRYFQLMNELVDDEEDVRVLKRFGVVRGRWKREGDVVDFVKKVGSFASHPSIYPAVEDEIGKMRKWHDESSRKFLVRYGWALRWASVVAASIVATAIFAAKRRG